MGDLIITKPMLAASIDAVKGYTEDRIKLPVWGSIKTDGIRTLCMPTGAVTRKLLPIPNDFIRTRLSDPYLRFMDGEVHALDRNGNVCDFNTTQSVVMTKSGEPDFVFKIFDFFEVPHLPFYLRYEDLKNKFAEHNHNPNYVELVTQQELRDLVEIRHFGKVCVEAGHEGAIIRIPQAPYKEGRATFLQGWLTKWVPYERAEGVIIGFEELMHNNNPATTDNLGHTKRSSHKANKVGAGILGAFVLQTEWGSLNVGAGQGLDHALRQKVWENRDAYLQQVVSFKYKPYGMKNKPRHPIFMGFRDPRDMS